MILEFLFDDKSLYYSKNTLEVRSMVVSVRWLVDMLKLNRKPTLKVVLRLVW